MEALSVRFGKIKSFDVIGDDLHVAGQNAEVVADEKRRGRKSRHEFHRNMSAEPVKKDIIAVAAFGKVGFDVRYGNLQIVGNGIEGVVVRGDNVEFAETDAGMGGGVQRDAVPAVNEDAVKAFRFGHEAFIDIFKADELHMRMAHGAAGKGAVVFEKNHGTVFAAGPHGLPVFYPETDKPMHVLRCIVRHIAVTAAAFDEHKLISVCQHIVFIAEQNQIIFFRNDVLQIFAVTEWAGILPVDNVFRFVFSEHDVKMNQVGFHGSPSLVSRNELRLA